MGREDMRKNWKSIMLGILLLAILGAVLFVGLTLAMAFKKSNATTTPSNVCALQESKPVLIIVLRGIGATSMCKKIITSSKGRYFLFYGEPSPVYQAMCDVFIKRLHYIVYDIVPPGGTSAQRYSMLVVCPLLQNHHRLIGEGF
jgi:hypothetical protein